MSSSNQLIRHQEIYQILKSCDEVSAKSLSDIHKILSEKHHVTRKTIERDLDHMSSTHRILATEGYPNRFYVEPGFKVDYQFNFSDAELQTIILALQNLHQTSPEYLRALCLKTEASLLEKLPEALKKDLSIFKELHYFSYGINGRDSTLLDPKENGKSCDVILEALRKGKTFTCNYSSFTSPESIKKPRHYEPHLFQLSGGIGYIYVKDLKENKFKNLRLSRFLNAQITDQSIKRLSKKEIKGLKESFGGFGLGLENPVEIKIECDEVMANAFGERVIHESQKIIKKGDRFIISLRIAPTTEINRLLKGWGDHVLSIPPKTFRE